MSGTRTPLDDGVLETGKRKGHHKGQRPDRPFIAWDGEGITSPGETVQDYVLFGCSLGDRIISSSLGTEECLELLLRVEAKVPDAIHVGFALQYDTNMILKDLSRKHLWHIYRHNKVNWKGYRIEYRPGKWLNVRRAGRTVRLYDVFGYFQASFVSACEKFLGADDPELGPIREGKLRRKSFAFSDLRESIIPYWEGELRLLVRLMDSLRDDLESAGLRLASWHGPGSVANKVFAANQIGKAKAETPKEVNRAAQYAYAGGRFELFQAGHYPYPVYEYDINSAYPTAIARLPNIASGAWKHTGTFEPGSFGIWHIRYDANCRNRSGLAEPQPLFYRDRNGNVAYPALTEGWYWTPEAELVNPAQIKEGWVLEHDGSLPFAFVHDMYDRRRQWKENGNSAERALKLALNSLYGKMAQRVGWTQETGIPKWHQLEWAGYVTSMTRATLWNAVLLNPESIVATETDAIFSVKPLTDLPIGKGLGQWELSEFEWITYLQNGVYFAGEGGKVVDKYRGFDKGSLPYDDVKSWLAKLPSKRGLPLFGKTTRFIGMGLGLRTHMDWCSWQTDLRALQFGGGGKRAHVRRACPQCREQLSPAETLHTLSITSVGGLSYPHSLPWLDDMEPVLRAEDELARW